MTKPTSLFAAIVSLALAASAMAQEAAQNANNAEELPAPEEKSVLVNREDQLQPPLLLTPPRLPNVRTAQPERFASPPPPADGGDRVPVTNEPRENGFAPQRLVAPAAPNLGSTDFAAGAFVPIPVQRANGPLLVNPGVQVAPQVAAVGVAGRAAPVRIKDGEKRFPGGVVTTVKVYAPANPKREAFGLASPQFVEVWVPPFAPQEVKRNRDGSEIKLDFGEYEVKVHFRRDGRIEVDYDD